MKVLELFAGTRSIGKAFESRGHEVFSVEWSKDFENIDLYEDISKVAAEDILRLFGKPDVIWASPDCSTFSIAAISHAEFCGRNFKVASSVLIPRPETAELVELIVEENPNARRLLDIGTGSGCIAISLDKKLLDAEVEAWDISEEALAIARKNNDALEARVRFLQRDVLADDWKKIPSFDVIVSNPPYVTETEKNEMDANVLDWEPGLALFVPDEDPLRFYNRIARLGSELLLPGGKLYFEINQAYGRETAHILEMNQYRDVRVIKDIFGKDRIVTANR